MITYEQYKHEQICVKEVPEDLFWSNFSRIWENFFKVSGNFEETFFKVSGHNFPHLLTQYHWFWKFPNHNLELRCVICTGVTPFASLLHILRWCYTRTSLLSANQSRVFFSIILLQCKQHRTLPRGVATCRHGTRLCTSKGESKKM